MSPILGVVASSKYVPIGSFEAIQTLSGDGSSDTITFSSIPQTYSHLQIRGVQQVMYGSSDYGNTGVRFNNDSGTNYTYHFMRGYNESKQAGGVSTGNLSYGLCTIGYLQQAHNIVFGSIIDILEYTNTSKKKIVRATSGGTYGSGVIHFGSTLWNNTAAINTVSLFASNGAWSTKSKFTLYGIKGE